ncbi:MAG: hypothetical protein GEU74_00075 [Nitriliruptorales bacterium]|nr:hypothetical protein [Nitriliruptorales bacterium]
MMQRSFSLTPAEVDLVFHALRYYAADLVQAFVEDDESPLLDDAVRARDLAARLQEWLLVNHQSLVRDSG